MMDRQTGRTTAQMTTAPIGAVYVWCNRHIGYPAALAKMLDRKDLAVRPLSWLTLHSVMGSRFRNVIVDHAVLLNGEVLESVRYLRCCGAVVDMGEKIAAPG